MQKRMKKNVLLVFLIFVLLCSYFASSASENKGNIKISLTNGAEGTSREGVVFGYCKVEDIELNQVKNAKELSAVAEKLAEETQPKGMATTDSQGVAKIPELEAGVYLLTVIDASNYDEITPTIVRIPFWDEDTKEMSYDVTVVPKHTPVSKPLPKEMEVRSEEREMVRTGDSSQNWIYVIGMMMGVMVAVICLGKRAKTSGKKRDKTLHI